MAIERARRWAAWTCLLLTGAGCTGGQSDDVGSSGAGEHCSDGSPRTERALEGALEARVAGIEGRYEQSVFWIDDAAFPLGFPEPDFFVDATEAERVARLRVDLARRGDTVVSFRDCEGALDWVPVRLDIEDSDGLLPDSVELWLELGPSHVTGVEGALTMEPGPWRSPELPDPERARGRIVMKALFEAGRMKGFLEPQWPTPGRRGEWDVDTVRGHFPTLCDGEEQLPVVEAVFGMAPAAAIERLQDLELPVDWGDGRLTRLWARVSPHSETACHVAFDGDGIGRALFTFDLTLSDAAGDAVARATLDATLAYAPSGCGSPPSAPCQGAPAHSLGGRTAELEVLAPATFYGDDVDYARVSLRLSLTEKAGGWVPSLEVTAVASGEGESLLGRLAEPIAP